MRAPHGLVIASVLLFGASGLAQPREGRRDFDALLRSAVQHYEAGQAAQAIGELERAYAMRPLPRLLYNLGRAHERAGDLRAAIDYYNRFLLTSPDAQAEAIAREALASAQRRQADEDRARAASTAADQQRALDAERVRAAATEQQRAEDDRRRQMTAPTHRRLTTPVIAMAGVTGAALVAGGILGGLALSAHASFDASHQGADRDSAYSRGTAFALGADVGFGVALVAAVTGVVLYFTQTPVPDEATAAAR